jgi:hypothetical protein
MKSHCHTNQIPSAQCLLCSNYGNKTCPMFSDENNIFQWAFSEKNSKENNIL